MLSQPCLEVLLVISWLFSLNKCLSILLIAHIKFISQENWAFLELFFNDRSILYALKILVMVNFANVKSFIIVQLLGVVSAFGTVFELNVCYFGWLFQIWSDRVCHVLSSASCGFLQLDDWRYVSINMIFDFRLMQRPQGEVGFPELKLHPLHIGFVLFQLLQNVFSLYQFWVHEYFSISRSFLYSTYKLAWVVEMYRNRSAVWFAFPSLISLLRSSSSRGIWNPPN